MQKYKQNVKQLDIEIHEAVYGAVKEVLIDDISTCERCNGKGYVSESENAVRCPRCKSTGYILVGSGGKVKSIKCPSCKGNKYLGSKQCEECGGTGNILSSRSIKVKIPPGVRNNSRIKIFDKKNEKEIIYKIRIIDSGIAKIKNNDIHIDFYIPAVRAILGGEIEIPTFYGEYMLSLPPGINDGKVIVIKGYGIRSKRENCSGDLFLKLKIEIPKNLTCEQKNMLKNINI